MNIIPFEYQPYFVLIVIFLIFAIIYKEWLQPAVCFGFGVLTLLITGIISADDALAGFSSQSIATVLLLILISAGLRDRYNIELLFDKIFARAKSYRRFLLLMMTKVALLSSVISNTPIVVIMTPYVFSWGKKNSISPSKLLIPLSYATIVGGMITVIGTSTTMVLNGFLMENDVAELKSTDLLIIGLMATAVGILFITLFGNKLLPDHADILDKFEQNRREYLVEKRLDFNSSLIGQTVEEGGLRNLKGGYLVEIVRGTQVISPVKPTETIEQDDVLIFAGNTEHIIELTQSNLGLYLPKKAYSLDNDGKIELIETVISGNSSLLGKTVKESNFRNRYDAAVVAIHRNGEKLSGKIGDIKLKSGDVLLLFSGPEFINRVDLYRDIYVISTDRKVIKNEQKDMYSLALLGGIVVLMLFTSYFSLFTSVLIVFAAMIGLKMITMKNIKRDLDFNLAIILVLSIALGQAMVKTKAGDMIALWVLDLLQPFGVIAIICGLMIITTVLTSFITNVGAVAITFPLAYSLSQKLGLESSPLYLAIAFSASAAFLTPIGYQTNLIVFGPGGYKFKDFFKIGLPMTLVYLVTVLLGIILLYKESLF
ncbi:MAG: SLC13 family permease [Bacteroidota bacterium]